MRLATDPPSLAPEKKYRVLVDESRAVKNKAVVRGATAEWSLWNDGAEMRESHGLETYLNRRMDFTGILERISSIISSGNEFLAFCADRSSGCSSSRVSIFFWTHLLI
ncbi:hypothetical protein Hanom_Chr05g00427001 [Helianthus anomalus]